MRNFAAASIRGSVFKSPHSFTRLKAQRFEVIAAEEGETGRRVLVSSSSLWQSWAC